MLTTAISMFHRRLLSAFGLSCHQLLSVYVISFPFTDAVTNQCVKFPVVESELLEPRLCHVVMKRILSAHDGDDISNSLNNFYQCNFCY